MTRSLVGVLCCNEVAGRPVQAVATRFVAPLAQVAGASAVLIPAVPEAVDIRKMASVLDGLLLTGSRTHVAPDRYGASAGACRQPEDPARDAVALALAERMIEQGKPVYGICRGMQEINVLFGGTLSYEACSGRHQRGAWDAYSDLFDHRHDVSLATDGRLRPAAGAARITVNSVHEQGIDRLGVGLAVEAVAIDDGLIEAITARPCGADVLAVQWHPEWDLDSPGGRSFFDLFGASLRDVGRNHPQQRTTDEENSGSRAARYRAGPSRLLQRNAGR